MLPARGYSQSCRDVLQRNELRTKTGKERLLDRGGRWLKTRVMFIYRDVQSLYRHLRRNPFIDALD